MNDRILREQLIELLTGAHAHVALKQALKGLGPSLRGKRPAAGSDEEVIRLAADLRRKKGR